MREKGLTRSHIYELEQVFLCSQKDKYHRQLLKIAESFSVGHIKSPDKVSHLQTRGNPLVLAQCASLREHLVAGVTFVSNNYMKMRFFHMPRKALLIHSHTTVIPQVVYAWLVCTMDFVNFSEVHRKTMSTKQVAIIEYLVQRMLLQTPF
jgi:hypothetical protein